MLDRWDVVVIVGAVLVAVGFWFVWPPAVAFWLGIVFIAFGLAGARRIDGNIK
jgi:hypothetical protein